MSRCDCDMLPYLICFTLLQVLGKSHVNQWYVTTIVFSMTHSVYIASLFPDLEAALLEPCK